MVASNLLVSCAAAAKGGAAEMAARCRVLLADDHEVVRRGLRTLLEANPGFEVCGEACTGREAVLKTQEFSNRT